MRASATSPPRAEALTEPLRQAIEEPGLPDLGDDEALRLRNSLFDPRDTLGLAKSRRAEDEAATRLVTALRGALIGWARAAKLPLDRRDGRGDSRFYDTGRRCGAPPGEYFGALTRGGECPPSRTTELPAGASPART